ncbi:MAG: hypothetical protein P1U85_04990 [Verrucomicrobiales bacterium]|nr:hypothetical protein [Verrucomicrobiales bacterium]
MNDPDSSPNQEQEVFQTAVSIRDPEERQSFVEGACAGDLDLQNRVEDLLKLALGVERDTGERTHLATTSDGEIITIFVNGELKDRVVVDSSVEFSATPHPMYLGGNFEGKIEQFRVSKGVRYEEGFTPPSQLRREEATIGLYLFEAGEGLVLRDHSGNEHHGQIIDATWVGASD